MSRSTTADDPTGTKLALRRAAVGVVASDGLRGLTYRAVARAAGCTTGAVQHHFSSIDDLLQSSLDLVLEESAENGLIGARTGVYADGPEVRQRFRDSADLQVFQYQLVVEAARRPELRPVVRRLYDGYLAAVGKELAADGGLAQLVFYALDGMFLHQAADPDVDPGPALEALRGLLAAAR
ncbi:TetR family transcriptional regulator [Amycolatopsis rubida]|uniref:TetR family transcriptional regulator n=1 Tax=Amycolatopsis rubida TaxID=112413 RepID=A0A1I6BEL4_9PSEU|nr:MULTISPECIES: TetR/AcrR family transcriptional regulator [Amycolatopsis]MYW89268.1 TetR family transcriptional regulator [Amycolatopsis rubida]NEC54246.1 TetR family transcriptional regulator [Amycolatopsis rubida]OAP29151.1 Bacterial regulatory protein, tetR family [Amycolatopsis sp. M39]SFQ79351.1 transcriptional regulator, TetR family [Amycolatopsis rubida]